MTKTIHHSFHHFILRSPLFPINFLENILSKKDVNETQIQKIIAQKEILESIFLASPNLHSEMLKWLSGEITDKKEINKLYQSIYKYLARMSSRCTPFGLFAGNSVGIINGQTNLTIPELFQNQRVTRLDMNYLCSLVQDLAKRPDIREISLYHPNNSIYKFGNKLRYVEYHYLNTRRTHHIAAVDYSDYLNLILGKAKKGTSVQNLAEILVDDEINFEEAKDFIHELIDSQLLLAEFEPSVTGNGFLENILDFLKGKEIEDNPFELLSNIYQQLLQIDAHPPGAEVQEYYNIAENLKTLGTNYDLKYLFQTDMVKPIAGLSINKDLVENIKEGIEVLNKLSAKTTETNLTKFRDAFYKKYEDSEIPLLQALDTELGIGYLQNQGQGSGDLSPLIDNIYLGQTNNVGFKFEWNPVYSFLFKKYIEAVKENKYEIEITEKEIDKLFNPANSMDDLPVTISSMVQLFKWGEDYKILMTSAGGSSAANLMGRFCHTDKELLNHVGEIVIKEEEYYQNQVIAEIVHLPESRIGNILHRPILRKYEIPYLSKSSVPAEFQILPEDLMVSVKNNRIVLRSKRLNKEIIPRLTSAHNFSNNALPFYQFLCDMQTQDVKGGVGFNWGPLANNYPFLQRVCYKNLIFSLASWNIQKQDFEKLITIKEDEQLLIEIEKWRTDLNMPEWVALEDGDNELAIKLSNILSVKTLISTVKNRSSFKLIEFFADEEKMVVKNKDGVFTNEIIFSFYREPNK